MRLKIAPTIAPTIKRNIQLVLLLILEISSLISLILDSATAMRVLMLDTSSSNFATRSLSSNFNTPYTVITPLGHEKKRHFLGAYRNVR